MESKFRVMARKLFDNGVKKILERYGEDLLFHFRVGNESICHQIAARLVSTESISERDMWPTHDRESFRRREDE